MNIFKKKQIVEEKQIDIEYYEDLEELPLYNWDRYQYTSDDNWFIIGFNGRQPKINNEKLSQLKILFLDEYYTSTTKDNTRIQKIARIEYLKLKYDTIITIIDLIKHNIDNFDYEGRHKNIKILEKLGFKIPLIATYEDDCKELTKIYDVVQGIKTQIKILNDEVNDGIIKVDNKKSTLNKELILVSKGLELGCMLNAKEISVNYWIELCKMLEEKISKQK